MIYLWRHLKKFLLLQNAPESSLSAYGKNDYNLSRSNCGGFNAQQILHFNHYYDSQMFLYAYAAISSSTDYSGRATSPIL